MSTSEDGELEGVPDAKHFVGLGLPFDLENMSSGLVSMETVDMLPLPGGDGVAVGMHVDWCFSKTQLLEGKYIFLSDAWTSIYM